MAPDVAIGKRSLPHAAVVFLLGALLPAGGGRAPRADAGLEGTLIDAGGSHSCAVASDESLACWGSDYDGAATPPAGTFGRLSAGEYHTCAARPDGFLVCWGLNGAAPRLALAPSCCLPDGEAGVPSEIRFQASGGIPPYSYSVAHGTLPPGLTLGADGLLTGTPSAPGSYDFTIRAADALPYPLVIEAAYALVIREAACWSCLPSRGGWRATLEPGPAAE